MLRRGIVLLSALCLATTSVAQKTPQQIEETRRKILADPEVSLVTISPQTQAPSLIQLQARSREYDKSEVKPLLDHYLSLRSGLDQLKPDRESRNGNVEVLEFQQYFKGVKVDRAKYKAMLSSGYVNFYSGAYYHLPASTSTTPTLSVAKALEFARGHVKAKVYAEEEIAAKIKAGNSQQLNAELRRELAEATPKGQLVFIKDFTKQGVAEMRLAYKFNIYAAQPLSRGWVYVDAHTGKILLYDAIIKHAGEQSSVSTTVKTRYAGNREIKTKQISGTDPHSGGVLVSSHPTTEVYVPGTATWVLQDDSRGHGIETYDMNGVGGLPLSIPSLYIQGKSFTDVDNIWSLAEHKRSDPLQNGTGEGGALEAENDDIAWDAHWGAATVYDYWLGRHNRRSFDNMNGKIKSFVHYGPAYDNAFWNGSFMTYGDGSGTTGGAGFKALTSLDVCGHEIGHAICTYTSDLVYASESGAMNEALSDIWAACVERYVIVSVDNSLGNVYRPFYIGEQIGATADDPLRRMDNPKSAGDPDTYGGQNWRNPVCAPDLVNDYCGVHTNSGVLNKWFYLLTVGSHAGSGPDARYARTDSDDGVNDLGNTYNVTGIGFDISEKIVYMMEQMLSSTATFAEARDASIAAAIVLSGDACSPVVQSVINAWYAVGVGAAWNGAGCVSTYGFVQQPGVSVNEGAGSKGCAGEYDLKVRILLPPGGSATLSAAGTATAGIDYNIPQTTISNPNVTNQVVEASVLVRNDAVIEPGETITLQASLTNTGSSPVNTSFTININEDDIVPVITNGSPVLLSANFNDVTNGFNLPSGWAITTEVAGNNNWGVWDGQLKITPSVEGVTLQPGTYDNLSPTSTIVYGPQVDATGLSGTTLKFDFRVQGEVDANGLNPDNFGIFDYMAVVYSLDGVNFREFNMQNDGFGVFCSLTPTSGTFEVKLPAYLANRKFYIGFRWYNDTNAGGPESVSIDNLTIAGIGKEIETEAQQSAREMLQPGQEVYFFSQLDGEILSTIRNNSSRNFGCTNVYIERGGNDAFNLYYGNDGLHKVAGKVFRVEPALISKGSVTYNFYYTEAEIAALEASTAMTRTSFSLYHVDAASYAVAAQKNTKKYAAVYTAIPGAGGIFTTTINNDEPIGSFALGAAVSVFAAKPAGASMTTGKNSLVVYPNPVIADASIALTMTGKTELNIDLFDAAGKLLQRRKDLVPEGRSVLTLPTTGLASGSYLLRVTASDGTIIGIHTLIRK